MVRLGVGFEHISGQQGFRPVMALRATAPNPSHCRHLRNLETDIFQRVGMWRFPIHFGVLFHPVHKLLGFSLRVRVRKRDCFSILLYFLGALRALCLKSLIWMVTISRIRATVRSK